MTDDTPTPALGGLRRALAQRRLKRRAGGPPTARRIRAQAVERAVAHALSGGGPAPSTVAAQIDAKYESARRLPRGAVPRGRPSSRARTPPGPPRRRVAWA
jgi:hypothetical protein